MLFLDDSGKPSFNDPSQAVVVGGFSVPSARVPALSRSISGAKTRNFPARGDTTNWELKARSMLRSRRLSRSRNLRFLREVVRILERTDCTVYTASIDKRRTIHEMTPESAMRLQLRALTEHFAVECSFHSEIGILVCDWSKRTLDARISLDIARLNARHDLPIHPGVYFSDSLSSQAIQVADLVAGATRRSLEGDLQIRSIAAAIMTVRSLPEKLDRTTHRGRAFTNAIQLI